ncbi:copine-9-like isoform X2 [Clytia hemisphaerica]|uniref:Copine-3 n=1 Tax=Clytia hemisphaerica TaxID=252671 RepID=A0A7M5X6B4_9CNID
MSIYNPSQQQQQPYGQPPPGQQQAPYPGSGGGGQAPYPGGGGGGQASYPGQQAVPGQQMGYQQPGPGQPPPQQTQMQMNYRPHVQPVGPPLSKIEITIACKNLLDLDVFSKSDPFVIVSMMQGQWVKIGQTEVMKNELNPTFVKSFTVDYYFEEQQMIKFEVYDEDSSSNNVKNHDFLGCFVTSLGSIVGEHGGKVEHPLQNTNYKKKSAGTIIIRSEEVGNSTDELLISLCGKNLDKKDFFGKSDPYLIFEKCNEDNSFTKVHKTEIITQNLNPAWKPFRIAVRTLCNGDLQRTIRVSCFDWDNDGSSDFIGSFETSAKELIDYKANNRYTYELINAKKKAKSKKYKNSGTIHLEQCTVEKKPSFVELMSKGIELNFIVAIDFTASNGEPNRPDSLHYNTQNQPSQYVQALDAIGGVLEDYDTDKRFPAYGFGAKIPPSQTVLHDFALNFNPQNPFCQGVQNIIGAYYHSIRSVQLYGPTNFSPVINNTIRIAQQNPQGKQYFVLMILTDGIITDMNQTKEAIVNAANLPISIIIVGVGTADFSAMDQLDGDDVRVSSKGRSAARDIVQFVPFRDYLTQNRYDPANGVRLAQNVLHELPSQLVEYYIKHPPNL